MGFNDFPQGRLSRGALGLTACTAFGAGMWALPLQGACGKVLWTLEKYASAAHEDLLLSRVFAGLITFL